MASKKKSHADTVKEHFKTLCDYHFGLEPDEQNQKFIDDTLSHISKLDEYEKKGLKEKHEKLKKGIEQTGQVLVSGVNMIGAMKNKDWYKAAEYGLAAVAGGAVLICAFLGPEAEIVGAVIAAVCSVIAAIISVCKPKEESLISQIRKVIVEELKKYEYNEVTKRRVQGWCQVEGSIISELSFFHQKIVTTRKFFFYEKFNQRQLDNERELMGELVFLANEQFNELAEERKDDNKSAEKCLACLGGYASIASYYIMVLSLHKIVANDCLQTLVPGPASSSVGTPEVQESKAEDQKSDEPDGHGNKLAKLFQNVKQMPKNLIGVKQPAMTEDISAGAPVDSQVSMLNYEIEFLDMKIEKAKKDARDFLGFLSNEGLLGPAGWWLGKVRVMKEYRQTPSVLGRVEEFRALIGCSPTDYTVDFAQKKLDACIAAAADVIKLAPRFQMKFDNIPNDNNHLLVINSTRWPVRVFSGLVGTHKNEFTMRVKPHSPQIHPATVKPNDTYSASGIITIGEEGDELCHMKNVQYIEYGISNNYSYKIHTNPFGMYSEDHLKDTNKNGVVQYYDDPKRFSYNGQMCFVRGELWENGKFRTSVIFIEEFNEEQLIKASPDVI